MKRGNKEIDFIAYLIIRLAIAPPVWSYRILVWPIISLSSSVWVVRRIGLIQRTLKNISLVFPEKSTRGKKALLKRVIWNAGLSFYESSRLYRWDWLNRKVAIEGISHLDEALAQGKGVVALSVHLGSFPLILSCLKQRGYPVRNIGRDPDNPFLAGYFEKVRKKAGVVHITKNPVSLSIKESLRWLAAGGILSLPSDQYTSQGIPVPFFGQKVLTPTGPAVFARRLGCTVLPVSIVRRHRSHLIRIEPPLLIARTENQEEDIKNNTVLFNRVIEKWVLADPDQWFGWFTRRFK